jgi:hypothetical protein
MYSHEYGRMGDEDIEVFLGRIAGTVAAESRRKERAKAKAGREEIVAAVFTDMVENRFLHWHMRTDQCAENFAILALRGFSRLQTVDQSIQTANF